MYKVFINDVLVFFSEQPVNSQQFLVIPFQEIDYERFFDYILEKGVAKINIISEDVVKKWAAFCAFFETRNAAGGVVRNTKGEFLWIHRFGRWDLPKGHIEKGESKEVAAVREVEEECGISGLKMIKPLETTYHMFQYKNKTILKVTFWFEMFFDGEETLIPQVEEGIDLVVFKDFENSKICYQNTYENLKVLLSPYFVS